jgi:hypothetical protein
LAFKAAVFAGANAGFSSAKTAVRALRQIVGIIHAYCIICPGVAILARPFRTVSTGVTLEALAFTIAIVAVTVPIAHVRARFCRNKR